jgi:UDP:flavonoid glycosyltransferase YjiC (YdhE family)
VLFIGTPGVGHVFPMVPLAWAFRSAGHEVLVATGDLGLAVSDAGLPVADIAPRFEQPGFWVPIMRALAKDSPELAEQIAAMRGGRRIDDLRSTALFLSKLSGFLAEGALELAHDWQPDLLVQSQGQGCGLVVAAKLGIPLLDHGVGLARTAGMHDLHRRHMAEVFDRYGVADLPQPRLTLDVAPPSLVARSGGTEGWPLRYVPYNGGAVLPGWLAEPVGTRPRVAVTLGTVATLDGDGLAAVRRVTAAAAGMDAEFVLALGSADTAALGPLPPNVRPAGWLPLHTLLPSCAALIHHGGSGTTLSALDAGVPQLVLPAGADRHINATAVAERGAGVVAAPADLDAALIDRVLRDAAVRTAAAEVSAELRAMPTPAAVAGRRAAGALDLAGGAR